MIYTSTNKIEIVHLIEFKWLHWLQCCLSFSYESYRKVTTGNSGNMTKKLVTQEVGDVASPAPVRPVWQSADQCSNIEVETSIFAQG